MTENARMRDTFGRNIDYMRISVTDRCNLRCRYCMPEEIELVPMEQILTYEEIEEICRAGAKTGIRKLKITGGEPLVRRGCVQLVGRLKQIPEIEQVTMTTNGVLLGEYLEELLEQGLDAVNISLDTLHPDIYEQITGRRELDKVLYSMEKAVQAGIPVKVNAVLRKEKNAGEWRELACLAKQYPVDVRFIEMMPIGYGKAYEAVCNAVLLESLKKEFPGIYRDSKIHGNGPAVYYRIPGFLGSVGFISAVHEKFCEGCNRLRLTSQGQLKPCLCFENSVDLRAILRETEKASEENVRDKSGLADERLQEAIRQAVQMKPAGHSFEKEDSITEKKKMIQIGG